MTNNSSSYTSFVWLTINVGLEDIFQNCYYNETITKLQLQSVSNVSYSTGRITRYNQFTRLFTCLSNSSSHSIEAAITIKRSNPTVRNSVYCILIQVYCDTCTILQLGVRSGK